MPYPGYLGASEVHISLLTYDPEGAAVQVTILIDGTQYAQEMIAVPAGSAPFVYNISCAGCYTATGQVMVITMYERDPSLTMLLDQDGVAITSIIIVDDKKSASNPADVYATLAGLTAGETYDLTLFCNSPAMAPVTSFLADAAETSYTYKSLPGICSGDRYLMITSPGQVHVATMVHA